MSESLAQEIAAQIVKEGLLQNWLFYTVLLALLLVALVVNSFVVAYFKRRGEHHATRADFEELLKQLRSTTDAAERVRTEISHADWAEKEWKTLRRIKLEELLQSVYEVKDWIELMSSTRVYGQGGTLEASSLPRIDYIGRLYFPELLSEVQAYSLTISYMSSAIVNTQASLFNKRSDLAACKQIRNEYLEEYKLHYKDLLAQASAIEKKASEVIEVIMSVTKPAELGVNE